MVLQKAIEQLHARRKSNFTISDIAWEVGQLARGTTNAQHILSCFKLLEAYKQVNRGVHRLGPTEQILMSRVLEDCEVVYFYLRLQDQAQVYDRSRLLPCIRSCKQPSRVTTHRDQNARRTS